MPKPVSRPAGGGLRRFWLPAFLTVLIVAAGMAYSLWWSAVVRHEPHVWIEPGDFWATFRDAHLVGWGYLSDVYGNATGLVTLPGYPVLLAPIAALSSALGLWESAPQVFLAKPHAWLVAGPFMLATAAVALFAFDALARTLRVFGRQRTIMLVALSVALWPSLALWGHPEDVLAIGLVAFAFVAAANGSWGLAGWLLGAAMSMQLLAVLFVPIFVGIAGARRSVPLLLRASVLPGFLLVAVLVPDFHDAWKALTQQPNYPTVDHPTPWVSLSPKLRPHVVAAGPARIFGLLGAAVVGLFAPSWRHDLRGLLWLGAVAMGLRCIFESVVDPYYVMPAVVLALFVGIDRGFVRWTIASAAGLGVTVVTFYHLDMWTYWLVMTALLTIMLVFTRPRSVPFRGLDENSLRREVPCMAARPEWSSTGT
jgi:hypothetical protein